MLIYICFFFFFFFFPDAVTDQINHLRLNMFPLFVRVKHVYGYEVVPEAIADARRNAKLNGVHNATFIQGDLNKISESFGNDFQKPDIVISGSYNC
ncbi:putative methyltransferase [Helianthus annuus]|nr:putative methyltransferase [Helianthus annuus]